MGEKKVKCAACKHMKKKCDESCPLAPHFPANRYPDFMSAHKVFGAKNIIKILNEIEPEQRSKAIKSIVIESNARKFDPVKGPVGIVRKLRARLQSFKSELAMAIQQLCYYKQQEYDDIKPTINFKDVGESSAGEIPKEEEDK